MKFFFYNKGFTMIELMISVTILGFLIVVSSAVYVNFFGSVRNIRAANLVYEETRFTMERIVKEIRNGTIDYEEYYNQNTNYFGFGANDTYGQNYCQYSRQFYNAGADGTFGTLDDESIGALRPDAISALSSALQNELFLINIHGTERTYIKRFERERNGQIVGTVGLLALQAGDYGIDHVNADDERSVCGEDEGEKDGRMDTWFCAAGFSCAERRVDCGMMSEIPDSSFIDITPSSLDIVDIRFLITPPNDPRKAYNVSEVQIQPHVTVRLTARAHSALTNEFQLDHTPTISLESTVSARVYNEIITECNLRECLPGQSRACSKTLGVCGPNDPGFLGGGDLVQRCDQGVWPGCSTTDYTGYADEHYDQEKRSPFDATENWKTYYENGSETASCGEGDTACEQLRCSDEKDNDCNGVKDIEDPACLLYLCNNGIEDAGEACTDVGGFCDFVRPTVPENTEMRLCFDNYDNDCNGRADEFDANCVNLLCNNGQLDPPLGSDGNRAEPSFALDIFEPKNVLVGEGSSEVSSALNEGVNRVTLEQGSCPDVGGLCSEIRPVEPETGRLCFDGFDNDCDGWADELDEPDCKDIICGNGRIDCGLVPPDFLNPNLLTNYSDPSCSDLFPSALDEECEDTGGICGALVAETTDRFCDDDKDNDCNGRFDGDQGRNSDPGCCPDNDVDGFFPIGLTETMACRPDNAENSPPFGLIDCNDNERAIFPRELEICDDAVYPEGDPLAGLAIDNNCSFANGLTPSDDLDRLDPTCCVDLDNDGYGIVDRSGASDDRGDLYIYRDRSPSDEPIPCRFSAFNHELGEETPDCNDASAAVNPGVRETGALCDDLFDNDCDSLIDDIDSFPDNFDPDCCDFTAMEICDNASDDNCNALRETDDTICMNASGRTFFENFASTATRADDLTSARWNGDGQITIDPVTEVTQAAVSTSIPVSLISECPNVRSVTLLPLGDFPGTSEITYQLSINGGETWCGNLNCMDDVLSGDDLTADFEALGLTGNDLRWRATLFGNGLDTVPTLNSLTLTFTCN